MFCIGVLALIQMLVLPGTIILSAGRIQETRIQSALYTAALSMLFNYLFVTTTTVLHAYNRTAVMALMIVETAMLGIVWIRNRNIQCGVQPPRQISSAERHSGMWCLLAIIATAVIGYLCIANVGTVFTLWDDAISWDRWACNFAVNMYPPDSGLYPLLLPANWSVSYVLIGDTVIKLFAKGIMPLFSLGILLIYWDSFISQKHRESLAAIPFFAIILFYLLPVNFICSGLADVPCAFFSALSIYAMLTTPKQDFGFRSLLPLLLACTAGVTKQAGLFVVLPIVVWMIARLRHEKRGVVLPYVATTILLTLIINAAYMNTLWNAGDVTHAGNVSYLTNDIHAGRSIPERILHAWQLLKNELHGQALTPIFWSIVSCTAIGALTPKGRRAAAVFVLPFYLLWAAYFSYDQRNLLLAVPFIAYLCGCAVVYIAEAVERGIRALGDSGIAETQAKLYTQVAGLVLAIVCYFSIAVNTGPCRSIKGCVVSLGSSDVAKQISGTDLIAGLGLALVLAIAFHYRSSVSNLSRYFRPQIALPVFALFCIVSQQTVLTDAEITKQQCHAQRAVGDPKLNEHLYELADKGQLTGVIATNYLPMCTLPGLKQHYAYSNFSTAIGEGEARKVLAASSGKYVLAPSTYVTKSAAADFERKGYRTIFNKDWWILLEAPHESTAQLMGGTH